MAKIGGGDQLGPITIHISADVSALKSALKDGLKEFDDFIKAIEGTKAKSLADAGTKFAESFKAINDALQHTGKFVTGIITPFKNLSEELKKCSDYAKSFVGALDEIVGHGIKVSDVMRSISGGVTDAATAEAKLVAQMRTKKLMGDARAKFAQEHPKTFGERMQDFMGKSGVSVFSRAFSTFRLLESVGLVAIANFRGALGWVVLGLTAIGKAVELVARYFFWIARLVNSVLVKGFQIAFGIIISVVETAMRVIQGIITFSLNVIKNIFETVFNAISFIIKGAMIASAAAITAFVAGSIVALKQMIDFQHQIGQAFTNIPQLAKPALDQLRGIVLDTLREFPIESQKLNEAFFDVVSTGFEKAAEASKLLRAAAKGAVAGVTDIKNSMSVLITIMKSYRKGVDEVDSILNTLMTTQVKGRLTFGDMARTLGTVSATANIAGISFEELAAAFVTTTLGGLNARATATSLRQLFVGLANPIDKARKMLEGMNIQVTKLDENGREVVRPLVELLPLFDKFSLKQIEMSSRTVRGMASLAIMVKNYDRFKEVLGEIKSGVDVVTPAFERMMLTMKEQAKLTRNEIKYLIMSFESLVSPVVVKALIWIRDRIHGIQKFLFEKRGGGKSVIEEAIESILWVLNPVYQAFKLLWKVITENVNAQRIFDVIVNALRSVSEWILKLTMLFTNFGGVLDYTWETLKQTVEIIWTDIKQLVNDIIENLFDEATLTSVWEAFGNDMRENFEKLKVLMINFISIIVETLIPIYFSAGWAFAKAIGSGIRYGLAAFFKSEFGQQIQKLASRFPTLQAIILPLTIAASRDSTEDLVNDIANDFQENLVLNAGRLGEGAKKIFGVDWKKYTPKLSSTTKVLNEIRTQRVEGLLREANYFLSNTGNVLSSSFKLILDELNTVIKQLLDENTSLKQIVENTQKNAPTPTVMPDIVGKLLGGANITALLKESKVYKAPRGPMTATFEGVQKTLPGQKYGRTILDPNLLISKLTTGIQNVYKGALSEEYPVDTIVGQLKVVQKQYLNDPIIKANKKLYDQVSKIFDDAIETVKPGTIPVEGMPQKAVDQQAELTKKIETYGATISQNAEETQKAIAALVTTTKQVQIGKIAFEDFTKFLRAFEDQLNQFLNIMPKASDTDAAGVRAPYNRPPF